MYSRRTAGVMQPTAARLGALVLQPATARLGCARQVAVPAAAAMLCRQGMQVKMNLDAANSPHFPQASWGRGIAARGRQWLSSAAAGMVDVEAGERAAVTISENCAKRILKVVKADGFLRLRVDGGGCSGFQYKFELDSESQEDDVVFEKKGAKLVVDETSLDLVRGSTIDFVEEMISSSFQVTNNPQSESSCGCGTSFAPKA